MCDTGVKEVIRNAMKPLTCRLPSIEAGQVTVVGIKVWANPVNQIWNNDIVTNNNKTHDSYRRRGCSAYIVSIFVLLLNRGFPIAEN